MSQIFRISVLVGALSSFTFLAGAQVLFEEISIQSGINHMHRNPMLFGGGIAVLDFDNDGWEDVYFTGGVNSDKLYRNLGNGQFENVSAQSGISALPNVQSVGVIAGDVDNDGLQDILVTTYWNSESMLLHNQGDGTFNYLPNAINDGDNWKTAASFGDFNNDGLLDIYITAYVYNSHLVFDENNQIVGFDHDCDPNMLFINNGNLTFSEVSSIYGVNDQGCGLATAFTDYDNDSDMDIHLANDFGEWVLPSALFQNQFPVAEYLDVSLETNMDAQLYGMGIAIGDYDRDADLDYYQTNLGRNRLSRNDQFVFTDQTTEADVENDSLNGLNTTSWGCFFFDADNDGWPDLHVANGEILAAPMIANVFRDPNKLFLNNGDGSFQDVSTAAGIDGTLRSRGTVYADFDKDGKLDMMVSNVHSHVDSANIYYYHNVSQNSNHWVEFDLEGIQSNRDAFGSHVIIWLNGIPTLMEVDGGSSHASKNTSILHFGVGTLTMVDSVQVIFPSGTRKVLTQLAVDQRYYVVEDIATGSTVFDRQNSAFSFEIFGELLHFEAAGPTRTAIEILDLSGKLVHSTVHELPKGSSILAMPVGLSLGVYLIRIHDGCGSMYTKVYMD